MSMNYISEFNLPVTPCSVFGVFSCVQMDFNLIYLIQYKFDKYNPEIV